MASTPNIDRERKLLPTVWGVGWVMGLLSLLFVTALPAEQPAVPAHPGKAIYQQHCLKCHGAAGWGDGPQARDLMVPPRNFHDVVTDLKSDEQLEMSVEFGVITSQMHSWRGTLSRQEIRDVVAYVRMLASQRPGF